MRAGGKSLSLSDPSDEAGGGNAYTTCRGTSCCIARSRAHKRAQLSTDRTSRCIQYTTDCPSFGSVPSEVRTRVRFASIQSGSKLSAACLTGLLLIDMLSDDGLSMALEDAKFRVGRRRLRFKGNAKELETVEAKGKDFVTRVSVEIV